MTFDKKFAQFTFDILVAMTMTFDLYFDVGQCHGYQQIWEHLAIHMLSCVINEFVRCHPSPKLHDAIRFDMHSFYAIVGDRKSLNGLATYRNESIKSRMIACT